MVDVAIQLYSVHEIDDDVSTIIEYVADTPLDGVELFEIDDPAAVSETLDRTGVQVAGGHVGLEELESEFEATVDRWSSVGVDRFVVPWADPEHFESRDAVEALADRLSALNAALDERGYELHYHNHQQEFVDLGGEYALDVLAELAPDIGLEIDLGWAGASGADPYTLVERYADRVDMVHVKDYDRETGGPAKVGEGALDLDAVADIAVDCDVEWLIYEYEDAVDTYETVSHAGTVMPTLKR